MTVVEYVQMGKVLVIWAVILTRKFSIMALFLPLCGIMVEERKVDVEALY